MIAKKNNVESSEDVICIKSNKSTSNKYKKSNYYSSKKFLTYLEYMDKFKRKKNE